MGGSPSLVSSRAKQSNMADGDDHVKGMGEAMAAAAAGMKLFEQDGPKEIDTEGAAAFKAAEDAKIAALKAEIDTLTGKDNKKARTEKQKEMKALKDNKQYIDAEKVEKGKEPQNGFFVKVQQKKEEAPKEEIVEEKKEDAKKKKDDKPKKAMESAGLSPDEKKELDKLKTDIIARKSELKAAGKSGGECNKDEQVVAWVARMTELKIKEDPSLADADKKKSDDKKKDKVNQSAEKLALQTKIEEYRMQLINEFQYSAKDIKADPDMMEMQKQLAKMK